MTAETRTTIGLGDIVAIEYQCRHCGTKTIRLLNAVHRVPIACGNCNHPWMTDRSREYAELNDLHSLIRTLATSSIGTQVGIRLEVLGIEAMPSASDHASGGED